jgi:hypothetical protein
MPLPADGSRPLFCELALALPVRVDDNLLLLSDIWLYWDTEKPLVGARIETIDLNGHRRLFWVKQGNILEAMTGELVADYRPHIWRYSEP